jgi:hypothetical protein
MADHKAYQPAVLLVKRQGSGLDSGYGRCKRYLRGGNFDFRGGWRRSGRWLWCGYWRKQLKACQHDGDQQYQQRHGKHSFFAAVFLCSFDCLPMGS